MHAPLSRPIRVGQIGQSPRPERVTATPEEAKALAAIFGLLAIGRLRGDFLLRREAAEVIAAELRLAARVTQTCVVTLEPFEAEVSEQAILRFVPAATRGEAADLAALDDAELEAPDDIPYTGETIDLGAALAEQLALALDPYPRKPGAELPASVSDAGLSPFSALAAIKPKT